MRSSGVTARGQNTPACKVVGELEGDGRLPRSIGDQGRVPVADKFKDGPKIEIQATITARIGAFLSKFLAANELRQHIVVAQVERIESVEAFVGIEVVAAAGDQIKDGFVQDSHGKFHWHNVPLPGANVQIN